MATRKPGRYLAPVALIAVLLAVILVVRDRTDGHRAAAAPPITTRKLTTSHPATRPQPTFFVVKASDTLSQISARTGVPVATLESLNPSINLEALQIGQKIRLRR
jgi:LysM repeat protein